MANGQIVKSKNVITVCFICRVIEDVCGGTLQSILAFLVACLLGASTLNFQYAFLDNCYLADWQLVDCHSIRHLNIKM
jgi:hypothetical protein